MDDLKPCPFCGAPAEVSYPSDPFEPGSGKPDKTLALIMCSRICVNSYASTGYAITAWNTRTAPKVKPLEWEGEDAGLCRAYTLYGLEYQIHDTWTGKYQVYLYHDYDEFLTIQSPVECLEDAISTAQADYERRILSALEETQ